MGIWQASNPIEKTPPIQVDVFFGMRSWAECVSTIYSGCPYTTVMSCLQIGRVKRF